MIKPKEIILTGFGAFGPNAVNPTEAVINALALEENHTITPVLLPVVYDKCSTPLEGTNAKVYLHLGLAASRPQLTLEKFAYNVKSAPIADNAGVCFSGEKILSSQPDILQTPFDVEELAQSLNSKGIKCNVSTDPGRYVCNNIYFHSLAQKRAALFVHLPTLDKLSLEDAIKAVKLIANWLLEKPV